jgi:hypothetical protein
MASNTIGTGAVVLTANADGLLAGLNKAQSVTEKWAGNTARKMNKAAQAATAGKGGKGGGILSAIIGGAAVGGAAGIAAGAALGGFDLITRVPEMLKGLRESSGQAEGGPLDRIIASVEKFQEIGTQLLATVISPLAPAFERAAEIAGGFFDRLQPIAAELGERIGGAVFSLVEITGSWLNVFLTGLEAVWPILSRVFKVAEVGLFLFEQLYVAIYDGIAEIIKGIAGWSGSWINLESISLTTSQAIFAALKVVAQGAGWVWDVFQFGAGIVATSAATIIDALKEVAKASDAIMGTDWAKRLESVGADLRKWGEDAMAGFGKSADIFGAKMDALQAKFNARAAGIAAAAHMKVEEEKPQKFEPVGAYEKGSKEAYSIIARWEGNNMMAGNSLAQNPVAIAKKQLDELKEVKKVAARFVAIFSKGTVISPID